MMTASNWEKEFVRLVMKEGWSLNSDLTEGMISAVRICAWRAVDVTSDTPHPGLDNLIDDDIEHELLGRTGHQIKKLHNAMSAAIQEVTDYMSRIST